VNKSNELLSKIAAFRTYAKYLPHAGRRETLEETINRNMQMHLEKFPKLSRDILKAYKQVHDLKTMPSMRSLQFGGDAIVKNNVRMFNCSYTLIENPRRFAEALYVLLCGTGLGFSVQKHHINQLPPIRMPKEEGVYFVHDSIEGWAESVNQLANAYFYGGIRPIFDFSGVRPKGSALVTLGAKAPGPEPLKHLLKGVEAILKSAIGRKLKPIEVHDIVCIIADGVLSGGIRRAALISLFDKDDKEMLTSKHGEWWNKHPYRARANNSAMLLRSKVSKDEFKYVYDMCIQSNAGEPGFIWTNDEDMNMGANPCVEISLNPNQMCNLTTTSLTGIKSGKDLDNRIYASALLGTLQASYTDFPYLSQEWQQTTEREALLGCSFTGIADARSNLTAKELQAMAKKVLEVNNHYANKIGINPAARACAIKPEGTASCVLGSSSGIHARFGEYYLRRIRMNKDDSLTKYLQTVMPELIEDDLFSSTGVVVTIPQESPKNAIIKDNETALQFLDRVLFFNRNWIAPGHRSGVNKHNVSATINYKPEEVDGLFEKLWDNRNLYTGVSLLPFDGGTYKQAPFESCTKEQFDENNKKIADIDLTKVVELQDNTDRLDQVACANGACEWTGES
jgi:ribonucleoside-diphosphate reductase alpha chain